MRLYQLFPEPLYVSKLERAFTKAELKLTDEYKKKTHKSIANRTTNDHRVLEHKTFKTLKQELNKMILDYFDKVVCTSNSITPYITQSWLNYTELNQSHHHHHHNNSYVSGVLYINADKAVDEVRFHKTAHPHFALKPGTLNIFNSHFSWHIVETGDVILFPSHLEHSVGIKKGTNTRISLSFNVFFKGTIGNEKNLTELVLK
tara:strand:+ start:237 stop:845 length:609 start_codon:yes stop_codon:yes gene_type:complete